jgi:hypothetical protein
MKNSEKSLQKAATKIAVFEDKKIRRIFHNGEWYFSVIDIVEVLTRSANPRRYWSDLKIQLSDKEGFIQLYGKIVQLKLESPDGKKYLDEWIEKRMRGIAIREELTDEWDKRGIKLQQRKSLSIEMPRVLMKTKQLRIM